MPRLGELELDEPALGGLQVQGLGTAARIAEGVHAVAGFDHDRTGSLVELDMSGFDLSLADPDAPAEESDAAAETIRRSLRELGYGEFVPEA